MTPIALAYVALVVWVVFVITYAVLARWWKSEVGINVMGVALVLVGLLGLIVAQNRWPDYALRPLAQWVVYGSAILFGIQRTVQVVRVQLHHRRKANR